MFPILKLLCSYDYMYLLHHCTWESVSHRRIFSLGMKCDDYEEMQGEINLRFPWISEGLSQSTFHLLRNIPWSIQIAIPVDFRSVVHGQLLKPVSHVPHLKKFLSFANPLFKVKNMCTMILKCLDFSSTKE